MALSRSELVLFARDARSALQKIVAAMPERALAEAHATAEKVRLIVEPTSQPDAEVGETIWRAVRDGDTLRIGYIDVGGLETERVVEPQHVVVGPSGSYLTAWCHLRRDDRVFRMDRITRAEPGPVGAEAGERHRSWTARPVTAARTPCFARRNSSQTPTQGCREAATRWVQPATPAAETDEGDTP